MKRFMIPGVLVFALAGVLVGWTACKDSASNNRQETPPPEANNAADNTDKPEKPVKPDKQDKPDKPNKSEDPGKVPTGELEYHGLVYTIPFDRGEGSAVFSRQNDMLRVEVDVRLPYSAGDGGQSRGSAMNLVLSVDGRNGRHLYFYPSPQWFPTGQGRVSAYRLEARYEADSDDAPKVVSNPSFVAEADIAYWDRWTAVMWVDLRYLLVPGNSPGSQADNWRAGLIVGNEVALQVLPEGMNPYNPGKTPERMLTFKYSELPELEALDDNPKDRLIEREEAIHDFMKIVDGQAVVSDFKGISETVEEAIEAFPEELWAYSLRANVAQLAAQRGIPGIGLDHAKYLLEYINVSPGQSSVHLHYLDYLMHADRYDEAKKHADRIFASGLCTGLALTDGHMRMEWARRCVDWGYSKEAQAQVEYVEKLTEALEDDDFRIKFKLIKAELAVRVGDSALAVEVYDSIVQQDYQHLDRDMTKQIQELATFQRAAVDQWKEELKLRELDKDKQNPRLVIETDKGRIVFELFEDDAPNTTASLVSLARKEFWDGLNFHRVDLKFVAQGGCPKGDGTGSPGYRTRFEKNNRRHFRGAVGMARSQDLNSQGSQFYICLSNGPNVLSLSDNDYLVVGRVIEGMDVADMLRVGDKIETIRAENLRDHEYEPEIIEE